MNDPAQSLKTLIESNWTLTSPNADDITFRVGEPINLAERFLKRDISIEFHRLRAISQPRNKARTIIRELTPIHVWIRIKPATENGKTTAQSTRQTIIDHIKSIIKENAESATDIKYMYQGGDQHPDELGKEPPVLHSVINVVCLYWT